MDPVRAGGRLRAMKTQLQWLAITAVVLATVRMVTAQPVETNAATISAALVRGIPGSTVNMPLSFGHTGTVAAVQYDLSFNPTRMSAGTLTGDPVTNAVLRSRQIAPGQYRVLVYRSGAPLLGATNDLGGVPFTVPAGQLSGGGGPVIITNVVASSLAATALAPIRRLHGNVMVGPVYRAPDGVVDLFLTVAPNRLYVIQATTDFVGWVNIATNSATQDYLVAQDVDAVNFPMRFYRAVPVGAAGGGLITSLMMIGANEMSFGYATLAGHTYVLQTSTNLSAWNNLTTNVAPGTLLNFTNMISPAVPSQFFRILELP